MFHVQQSGTGGGAPGEPPGDPSLESLQQSGRVPSGRRMGRSKTGSEQGYRLESETVSAYRTAG
jgi:hypothetical protein